jgi:hypothetical protein
MSRNRADLGGRQAAADHEHQIVGIVAAFAPLPLAQLLGEIGGRLPAERRVGRADALAVAPVAAAAGGDAARGVARGIKLVRGRCRPLDRRERQRRIIGSDRLPVTLVEANGNRLHLLVLPPAARIVVELAHQIADVERRQPRGAGAVSATVEAVAGEAGIDRAAVTAAQGDQAARGSERIGGRLRRAAAPQDARGKRDRE